ncbi:hypothetical protein CLV30_109191 [Haloactinopolyspora alba]|uniref:Major tail protein n=1 Tax=Haloactinopolyspora alba TaxID=648780 RepID=A0A2P8E087_9ACTN|nr:hypothetical protein [Haloactinopolyspora alba]PSL02883.1 hypothetical protein CLV30_109191 [Haloactinopolyspora alba]
MAFVHGKNTVITLGGDDLSAYTNNSELTRSADSHDVTTYGNDAHVFEGGLKNGTATMSGIYDNTADTGPRAVVEPLVGTVVELVRQPEGAGSGLPQDTVQVLVTNYVETNPVADMVTWSAELQLSGTIDTTPQV